MFHDWSETQMIWTKMCSLWLSKMKWQLLRLRGSLDSVPPGSADHTFDVMCHAMFVSQLSNMLGDTNRSLQETCSPNMCLPDITNTTCKAAPFSRFHSIRRLFRLPGEGRVRWHVWCEDVYGTRRQDEPTSSDPVQALCTYEPGTAQTQSTALFIVCYTDK